MKAIFITGLPTTGKSYLAGRIADVTGGIILKLDDLKITLSKDPRYEAFVNFYFNKDEKEYYTTGTPETFVKDLLWQSRGLWPAFCEAIQKTLATAGDRLVIVESVNLLPELVRADFGTEVHCLVLLGESKEKILERLALDPRWGNTPDLQELEAENFWNTESPFYASQAEQFRAVCVRNADEGWEYCAKILKI